LIPILRGGGDRDVLVLRDEEWRNNPYIKDIRSLCMEKKNF
jgi:hypothetical protein